MLKFLYGNPIGRILLKPFVSKGFSSSVGKFMDSKASGFLIKPFVSKNNIELEDFYSDSFETFNDCFSRKIKAGKRPVDMSEDSLISPCDGLLSAYKIHDGLVIPVKQSRYNMSHLLLNPKLSDEFSEGICLVFRLCTNHYHRYCYIDSGTKGCNYHINGIYHTVRPIALERYPVFTENTREYTVMNTDNFGEVVQIEVGAMLVGKIENHHEIHAFVRGEEKGMFKYGGSTIMLLLKKDAAKIDDGVFRATAAGEEIPVIMGQKIGVGRKSEDE